MHVFVLDDTMPFLIVANRKRLLKVGIQREMTAQLADIATATMKNIISVGVDMKTETIFWGDSGNDKIYSSRIDGLNETVVSDTGLLVVRSTRPG